MKGLILFCVPGKDTYIEMDEKSVAKKYSGMAIDDYDRLVAFDDEYMDFVETPDYEAIAGEKDNRKLNLAVFADQPIIHVGNVWYKFTSTSYLFNPETCEGIEGNG